MQFLLSALQFPSPMAQFLCSGLLLGSLLGAQHIHTFITHGMKLSPTVPFGTMISCLHLLTAPWMVFAKCILMHSPFTSCLDVR